MTTTKILHVSTLHVVRLVVAAIVLGLLLAQLFTFERFPALIGLEKPLAVAAAVGLVVCETTALPFWLMLRLPTRMVRVSGAAGFLALCILTILEAIAAGQGVSVLFGATFALPSGGWSWWFLLGLWILALWASGMRMSKSHKK